MADRIQRVKVLLCEQAADFINENASRDSMITVTDIELSNDLKHAHILVSVYPRECEKAALDFLKRQRSKFRAYIKRHAALKTIPFFDFALDMGEKKRQHIDALLAESNRNDER